MDDATIKKLFAVRSERPLAEPPTQGNIGSSAFIGTKEIMSDGLRLFHSIIVREAQSILRRFHQQSVPSRNFSV
jgi:hypothetical protein